MTSSTSSTSYALSTSSSGFASISGLSSGIDTSSLVEKFMQLEAMPQTKLKNKLVTNQAQTSLLQSINTKLKALTDSATKMSLGSTTSAMKVSTSDDKSLTASVTGAPVATTLTVTVTAKAVSASAEFTGAASADNTTAGWVAPASTTGGFPLVISANNKPPFNLSAASYAIEDVASAINASTSGVTAAIITDSSSNKHLVLTAASGAGTVGLQLDTGAGLAVSKTVTASAITGLDAQVTVNGIVKTSPSNTFADLVPGLSVTLAPTAALSTPFTVTTARDTSGSAAGVKGVVDALASVLSDLQLATTAPDKGTTASLTAGGLFSGDSTLRGVYNSLIGTVSGIAAGSTPGEGIADAGIEANVNGTVTVDTDKLTKYLTDNPALAQKVLTNFGTQLSSVASQASITGSGTLSAAITSLQSSAADLSTGISSWDLRLSLRQKTLTAQYTAMETALSKLQSQTTALTAALKQLDGNNGN